ncbi:MAG: hypothetical protein ACTSXJ_00060 [Candidatus Baldrarchaeia archaeon]
MIKVMLSTSKDFIEFIRSKRNEIEVVFMMERDGKKVYILPCLVNGLPIMMFCEVNDGELNLEEKIKILNGVDATLWKVRILKIDKIEELSKSVAIPIR